MPTTTAPRPPARPAPRAAVDLRAAPAPGGATDAATAPLRRSASDSALADSDRIVADVHQHVMPSALASANAPNGTSTNAARMTAAAAATAAAANAAAYAADARRLLQDSAALTGIALPHASGGVEASRTEGSSSSAEAEAAARVAALDAVVAGSAARGEYEVSDDPVD